MADNNQITPRRSLRPGEGADSTLNTAKMALTEPAHGRVWSAIEPLRNTENLGAVVDLLRLVEQGPDTAAVCKAFMEHHRGLHLDLETWQQIVVGTLPLVSPEWCGDVFERELILFVSSRLDNRPGCARRVRRWRALTAPRHRNASRGVVVQNLLSGMGETERLKLRSEFYQFAGESTKSTAGLKDVPFATLRPPVSVCQKVRRNQVLVISLAYT